jgi:hypothetical protein
VSCRLQRDEAQIRMQLGTSNRLLQLRRAVWRERTLFAAVVATVLAALLLIDLLGRSVLGDPGIGLAARGAAAAVFAIGAGVAAALRRTRVDPRLHTEAQTTRALGLPVLASIPTMPGETPARRPHRRRR